MKKLMSFITLAGLLGILGCGQSSDSTTPDPQPDADPSALSPARGDLPHYVQAESKLATLRAKFVYGGKPPAREKIDASKDAYCANLDVLSEKMLVGEDGGIQNLAIFLDERRSKVDIPDSQRQAPDVPVELDNRGCIFVPHVFIARPGQTIQVLNSDQTGHNANFNFFKNTPVNYLIPAGGQKAVKPEDPEPAPIPVECNVHPWMKSYVIIQDHPFVAISDEAGVLEIKDLPVGEVTFRVWHENAKKSLDEVTIGGKKETWRLGRMKIELKPGVNDLGTVTIAPEKFN